ncbi:hypothetical protein SDC9_150080 [bioreactor metagenome]|uniref:Uncharacterized protein n=1 Tax=bioreactor metagenome TaxID=1076179 RepID=A0A645ENZ0_9ZZZZ
MPAGAAVVDAEAQHLEMLGPLPVPVGRGRPQQRAHPPDDRTDRIAARRAPRLTLRGVGGELVGAVVRGALGTQIAGHQRATTRTITSTATPTPTSRRIRSRRP